MKERPILFSAPMVRAILEGRKTQTRRVVKNKYSHDWRRKCPYGQRGDMLWVRETWSETPEGDIVYRATDPAWDNEGTGLKWKPSIHMPRWARRITLEITDVYVERLREISEADAFADGVDSMRYAFTRKDLPTTLFPQSSKAQFKVLWESINGAGSWDANPWVWVISFEKANP